jgi:hypothetical protein
VTENGLTIEKYLEQRAAAKVLFTVEEAKVPLGDGPRQRRVKITPHFEGSDCSCDLSITVPADFIANVDPTVKRHACCGTTNDLVGLTFKDGAAISLKDLFNQLAENAADADEHRRCPDEEAPRFLANRAKLRAPGWGRVRTVKEPGTRYHTLVCCDDDKILGTTPFKLPHCHYRHPLCGGPELIDG